MPTAYGRIDLLLVNVWHLVAAATHVSVANLSHRGYASTFPLRPPEQRILYPGSSEMRTGISPGGRGLG